MRKIAIVFAAVAGLLVIGLAVLWIVANPNRHRERIEAALEKPLGREVTLGDMSLGFLPLRFQVRQPVISEDPRFGSQPFVQAESLDVRVRLMPLLSGNVHVDSVNLVRPTVELVRDRDGKWNFSTIGSTRPAPSEPGAAGQPAQVELNRIAITDGRLGITDLAKGGSRTAYDHIDLTILNFAPGKPLSFDLAAHLEGDRTEEIRLAGSAGPVAANAAATPLKGKLTIKDADVRRLMAFLQSAAMPQLNGKLSGETDIASEAGTLTASGKWTVADPEVNRVKIGFPIELAHVVKTSLNDTAGTVNIEKGSIQLGPTPIAITGTLKTAATPPLMDLRITSGDVSIVELARLAAAFGVAFNSDTAVTGNVNVNLRAAGSTANPAINGAINARDIHLAGPAIPQPVDVKQVTLTVTPTSIQSNDFTATSGKTSLNARFNVTDYTGKKAVADVAVRSPGATLPEIQSLAKAYGFSGLEQITGDGNLNFDLRAAGPVDTFKAVSALRALNGTVNVNFSPLKVLGFDAVRELGRIGGFLSEQGGGAATDIVKVGGQIRIKDGIAQTDNLTAQLSSGSLAATGTADLVSEALDMKLTAVFSKAFSESAAASRTGRLTNAIFSNASGEIVLPALMTGTFRQPRFAPDLRALAQLQRQKLIPSLNDPSSTLSNVLGILKGKQETRPAEQQPKEQTGQQEQKKGNIFGGILDVFRGKKPEQK